MMLLSMFFAGPILSAIMRNRRLVLKKIIFIWRTIHSVPPATMYWNPRKLITRPSISRPTLLKFQKTSLLYPPNPPATHVTGGSPPIHLFMGPVSSGVASHVTIPRRNQSIRLNTRFQSCATNVMPSKKNIGAAKRAIMHRILRTNAVYVTTPMHQKILIGLTNPSGCSVSAVILIRVTAGISLHLISGEPGIAGTQPTGFQTLQERGMNLPVLAAMIRTHLTPPCSSQNMAPGALICAWNAIGGINPEGIFREGIVKRGEGTEWRVLNFPYALCPMLFFAWPDHGGCRMPFFYFAWSDHRPQWLYSYHLIPIFFYFSIFLKI